MMWGATVTNIVDGDTFDVVWDNGYTPPLDMPNRIRVAGIDTNEKDTNQSFSAEATARLTDLIPVGTHVMLEARDADSSSNGRALRHVFVDGENVAEIMLEEGLGLAVSYEYEPDYRSVYFAAGEIAQLNGAGMWAEGASGGDPSTWSDVGFFVNYDAAGDDFLNVGDEFIHIQNDGPFELDLSGWTVRKAGKDTTTQIAEGTVLDVGESFRIYVGVGTDTANVMYLDLSDPFLDNSGDVVYLRDEHLNIRGYQLWQDTIFKGALDSIVIDDVQVNAPGADDATNPNGEWVQIRNAGDETVDLTHWRIKDDSADYVFEDGETLDPGETLKVFIGSGNDGGNIRYWGNTTGILNNENGKLEVWTPRSQAVDAFAWGDAEATGEDPRGAIRMFANYDGEGNDRTNPNAEWVALFNSSDSAIDLSGYSLKSGSHVYTFAEGTMLAANANMRVMVGSGSDTALNKFWGKPGGILSNGGDKVDLIDATDTVLLQHAWPNTSPTDTDYGFVIESVNFDAPGSDAATPNGEWLTIRNASSAEQNLVNWKIEIGPKHHVFLEDRPMASGDVVTVYIGSGTDTADKVYWGEPSGIMFNTGSRAITLSSPNRDIVETHSWGSAASPVQSVAAAIDLSINYDATGIDANNPNGEWVNLSNVSSSVVSLEGYHLYSDGTSYTFDSDDVIGAGERMRLYLGNGTDNGLERYADETFNPFNNTADEVELRRNDTGGTADSFAYPFHDKGTVAGDFKITGVNYDVPGVDDLNPNGEWIDITNMGSTAANLRDWRLQYQTGTFLDINDSLIVGAGDTVRVAMGQGTDSATNLYWGNTSASLSNSSGNLILHSNYRVAADTYAWRNTTADVSLSGTDGANTLVTGAGDDKAYDLGGDDIVILGDGDDYVKVGGGVDSFDGGAGKDYISYYDSSGGVTVNLATNATSGSWASNDVIDNFESISGSKTGGDTIYGTSGANTIKTYGGNDRVYAGSGSDRIELGDGNDYVRVGGGRESFDGGSGKDYISYYDSSGGIRIDLAADTVSGSWAVNDTIEDFESASGSNTGGDIMLGTSGSNTLKGFGGNDKLYGRSGNDKLYGGDGKDRFDGGHGTDTLYGGDDADVFHFDHGEDHDIIKDFENNVDLIELDNFSFGAGQDAFDFATETGGDVVFDFGGGDTLTVENVTISQLLNDLDVV